jgi:hypothetical protein
LNNNKNSTQIPIHPTMMHTNKRKNTKTKNLSFKFTEQLLPRFKKHTEPFLLIHQTTKVLNKKINNYKQKIIMKTKKN